jgi:hypothetical protein
MAVLERPAERQKCNGPVEELFTDCVLSNDGFAQGRTLELARPIVGRGASLDADQARWQLLEERQDRAPLQLAADDHLASGINSVNLEH